MGARGLEAQKKDYFAISTQAFRRLPLYYNVLKALREEGVETVSAPVVARRLRLNEVQVRKDLSAVSESGGRPRTGFNLPELLSCIGRCLGYDNIREAVLVGAGQLGRALLSYGGFEEYGMKLLAAFDSDPGLVGQTICGKQVFPMARLGELCGRLGVRIGVITVPSAFAQSTCDLLVESGIQAIWNFAPVHLSVPEDTLVHNENMAASLALLSQHLAEKIGGE